MREYGIYNDDGSIFKIYCLEFNQKLKSHPMHSVQNQSVPVKTEEPLVSGFESQLGIL